MCGSGLDTLDTMITHPPATQKPDQARPEPPVRGIPARVRTVHTFARPLTPEEFLALPPEDFGAGKLELVNGAVVEMPPVVGDHTDIAHDLRAALDAYVAERGGEEYGRTRLELAFRLPLPARAARPDPVRVPDVSLVTAQALRTLPSGSVQPGERLPQVFLRCAPLVAAEVLSGHDYDRWADVLEKVDDYLLAGVALVWLLSPRHETVTVYTQAGGLAGPSVLRRSGDDHLDGADALPGFRVPLAALFRPLPAPAAPADTPPPPAGA
jgi:Uma2 family endonuclease